MAVLSGDPSQEGFFVLRLKAPDGYRVAAHWPTRENLTIISGTFHLGMGDTLDTSKADAMPAGSFAYLDGEMNHYAWVEGRPWCRWRAWAPSSSTTGIRRTTRARSSVICLGPALAGPNRRRRS